MALFRLGREQEALQPLEKAHQTYQQTRNQTRPSIVAFLAMMHARLGHADKAKAELATFQALLKSERWSGSAQLQELLREVEATLSSR